jgi:hypothetical protein
MKYIIAICLFCIVGCKEVPTEIISPEPIQKIQDEKLTRLVFYNNEGNVHTTLESIGSYHSEFNISAGYSINLKAYIIKLDGEIQTQSGIGKTYTETFTDGDGNIRTKVYEGGILISYKINGKEQ